jgi:hypothetical protein
MRRFDGVARVLRGLNAAVWSRVVGVVVAIEVLKQVHDFTSLWRRTDVVVQSAYRRAVSAVLRSQTR